MVRLCAEISPIIIQVCADLKIGERKMLNSKCCTNIFIAKSKHNRITSLCISNEKNIGTCTCNRNPSDLHFYSL